MQAITVPKKELTNREERIIELENHLDSVTKSLKAGIVKRVA